jgi:ADP-ribose pyrophosphatase YjhB (NUDIX family)
MFKFCPYCGFKIEKQQKNGFECSNCKKWTHYASSPAVSILVKVEDEALIIERGIDPGKGKEDIVGGFLENGEESLDGAIREFKEEVGVDLEKSQLKFFGDWIGTYFYQGENIYVLNIIYLVELKKKFKGEAASDVASLSWVPITYFPKFAFPYLNDVWQQFQKLSSAGE